MSWVLPWRSSRSEDYSSWSCRCRRRCRYNKASSNNSRSMFSYMYPRVVRADPLCIRVHRCEFIPPRTVVLGRVKMQEEAAHFTDRR